MPEFPHRHLTGFQTRKLLERGGFPERLSTCSHADHVAVPQYFKRPDRLRCGSHFCTLISPRTREGPFSQGDLRGQSPIQAREGAAAARPDLGRKTDQASARLPENNHKRHSPDPGQPLTGTRVWVLCAPPNKRRSPAAHPFGRDSILLDRDSVPAGARCLPNPPQRIQRVQRQPGPWSPEHPA